MKISPPPMARLAFGGSPRSSPPGERKNGLDPLPQGRGEGAWTLSPSRKG